MEILTIHYKTPDLLERLIKSIRVFTSITIRVIDGSDTQEMQRTTALVCSWYDNIILEQLGYNIHHGRGLDYGLRMSCEEWVLAVDSEVQLLQGIIEAFQFKTNLEGFCCEVNNSGLNVKQGILYLHPELLLINNFWYKQQHFKFIHHGAPAIDVMKHASLADKHCMAEQYKELYIRGGRGTVNRFGYNF